MASLCVNLDHIATLRQARRGAEPDPVLAVGITEMAGSTGITVHLREDRRHIQERDVRLMREVVRGHLNLEMAATEAMVKFALELRPDIVTLVPEGREEVTTEGGLDVLGHQRVIAQAADRLQAAGIQVSLFIDPTAEQVQASARSGAREVEFYTGSYCHARGAEALGVELEKLYQASARAQEQGLVVNAGHGLDYHNVQPLAAIAGMRELNIGHAIISRAIFSGLGPAVAEMQALIVAAAATPQLHRPAGY